MWPIPPPQCHVSLQQIAGLIKGVFETPSPNAALCPGGLALGGLYLDSMIFGCSG